jgi:hypothetical protein
LPSAIKVDFAPADNSDFAGAAVAAENVKPIDDNAINKSIGVANLWRRYFDKYFTFTLI